MTEASMNPEATPKGPNRVTTRSTNSSRHPGLILAGQKRRTKADMEEHRKEQEAAKASKEQKEQEKVRQIADLEAQMDVEDENDETPRAPRHQPTRLRTRPLQRTNCVANFELLKVSNQESDSELSANPTDQDFQVDASSAPSEPTTDAEEAEPPKKKAKPSMRASIKAARELSEEASKVSLVKSGGKASADFIADTPP